MSENKQRRFTVTFRENDKEIELYDWIENKRGITPIATIIKELLYKAMVEEQQESK